MSTVSSALSISRGLAGPKSPRKSTGTTGNWLIFQCHHAIKVDTAENTEPGVRPVESEKLVDAVTAGSERSPRQRKLVVSGVREKTSVMSVPRSDTGTLAAKATACRENRR